MECSYFATTLMQKEIKMKNYILYPFMLLTMLFLSACSNSVQPKEKMMYNLSKMLLLKFQKIYLVPQRKMKLLVKTK